MAQFASSNFNGTDGDTIQTVDANWISHPSSARSFQIVNNRARQEGTGTSAYYYDAAPAGADYDVSVTLYHPGTLTGSTMGTTGRMSTSATTFYHARISVTGTLQLFKFVAGSATSLGSTTRTVTSGGSYLIELRMAGTAIELWWDGEGSAAISATDSAISAAGYPGIRSTASTSPTDTLSWQIEDFSADQAGGGPSIVTTSQSGSWSVRNSVAAQQAGSWSIRALVAAAQAGAWSVRNFAGDTQPGAWSVRNYATATQSGAYSIRNTVAASQAGAWSIDAAAGFASASQQGAWSVRNFVTATQSAAWQVRNFAQASQSAAWSVRAFATATQLGSWSILAPNNIASATQAGSWSVRNYVGTTQFGAWSVLADLSGLSQNPSQRLVAYPVDIFSTAYPVDPTSAEYPAAGAGVSYPLQ